MKDKLEPLISKDQITSLHTRVKNNIDCPIEKSDTFMCPVCKDVFPKFNSLKDHCMGDHGECIGTNPDVYRRAHISFTDFARKLSHQISAAFDIPIDVLGLSYGKSSLKTTSFPGGKAEDTTQIVKAINTLSENRSQKSTYASQCTAGLKFAYTISGMWTKCHGSIKGFKALEHISANHVVAESQFKRLTRQELWGDLCKRYKEDNS